MATLFVSHSSTDQADATRLLERLEGSGFAAIFLDFDPERGIPAGRSWERELYAQLRRADGVIFLATAASIASRWCFAELCLARSLGKTIFPVRLQRGVELNLLSATQWIDAIDGESWFTKLLTGLRMAGLDPADSFAWDPLRPPYPGLDAFAMEDAAVFFGRERETEDLQYLLQPTLRRDTGRFVAIVGPSGSGKSSLLHAGLLPRLQRQPGRWVVLPPLVPGRRPMRNLAYVLSQAFATTEEPVGSTELESRLTQGSAALVDLARQFSERHPGRPNVLLAIDQGEELVTLAGAEEQQEFVALLTGAIHDDSPLSVVATIRSEFLTSDPGRAGLAEAVGSNVIVVGPLSRQRLPEIIQRPAQLAGLEFAPGLVETMLAEVMRPDALPLLAYTLRELYSRVGREGTISRTDYAALGGVVGALQRQADRLAGELARRGHGDRLLPTLLKLVTIEEEGEPARRRLLRSELDDEERAIVDAFVEARLLTSGRGETGDATVEVAHEALLRQWSPLREAIESSRSSLRMRSDMERLATDWDRAGGDDDYLLRGARLANVDEWAIRHQGGLSSLGQRFLAASRSLASRELDRARRSNRRLRLLAVGLAVFLVAAVTVSVVAVGLNRTTRSQARVALSRQLAAQADRLAESEPETAILLGLESLSVARDDDPKPQPPPGLITALAQRTHSSLALRGHRGAVSSVAFTPDGTLLASASQDGTVRLWRTADGGQARQPLPAHTGELSGVAFSPDGKLLAAAGTDGAVRLWTMPDAHPLPPLTGHTKEVYGIAFSPDGRWLASGGADAKIKIWDVNSRRAHGAALTGHTDAVYRLAFSRDGTMLASASWDYSARIWDMASHRPHGEPLQHSADVQNVAFDPDGRVLVTVGVDQAVRFWDVRTSRQLSPALTEHNAEVHGVAFNPDGTLLATTDTEGTVRLWDVARRAPHGLPLTGHTGSARDVVFSPDGRLLATASWDHTVRLWGVAETPSISRPLVGHSGDVYGVAFSPDGKRVASASADGTVRLWDTRTGRQDGAPLVGHEDEVYTVAFSPDGKLLASAGLDGAVRVWQVASRRPYGSPLQGHTDAINSVAFSPDSKLLASASYDHTVRLWNVAESRPLGAPIKAHSQAVFKVQFSPDGKLLASASVDRTVRLWNVDTRQQYGPNLVGHTDWVNSVAFSPDGRLLASAGQDRTIRLWNPGSSSAPKSTLEGHTDAVTDVAFNRDGQRLASTSADRTVQLWNPSAGGSSVQTLTGHTESVTGVAFSPSANIIATASEDRTVRLWNLDFKDWVSHGCGIVRRNFSAGEWAEYVGQRPYERTCPDLPAGEGAPGSAPAARYGG